jgi:hypothetical protein
VNRPIDPHVAVRDSLQVEARYAPAEADGLTFSVGRVIAYTEVPTFVIERRDGSRFSWRADMTYPAADITNPA